MTTLTSKDLLDAARNAIEFVTPAQATEHLTHQDVVIVDVRDSAELNDGGTIEGAVHVPRGGLEFALDPASEFAHPDLTSGKDLIFLCGSGSRAAFAAKLAVDFGCRAKCLDGGFKRWKAEGHAVTDRW